MSPLQRRILVISIVASIVAFLDGSVASVALPAILKELGGGLALQQWVNDAYLITLGTLILAAGSLSDIFGRGRILRYGLVGFLITSLLCAASPDGLVLIIARALQGVAGALIVPSSLALIISHFKDEKQAKAIGLWTAWTGISFILGPLVGGLLIDLLSWRLVFAINVLPIVLALVMMRKIPADAPADRTRARVDVAGIVLGALGLGGVVFALIEEPNHGVIGILAPLILGFVLLVAFVVHQARATAPMVPLALFRVRNFSVGNVVTLLVYGGLALQGFTLVIFLQEVAHYPATLAGLASAPISLIMFVLAPRFGALSGKYGPRLFMSVGPVVAAIGVLLLLRTNADASYPTQVLPGILVFGVGLSMIVSPLTSAILGAISSRQAGIGSAINNAVSRIAGLISVALVGLVISSQLGLAGFHASLLFCAGLMVAGGIVAAIGITNRKPVGPAQQPVV